MEQTHSPAQHHCKDCGVFFDSGKSLDVHLQYHKENLLSKWATTSSSEESNNNNNVKQNHKLSSRAMQPDSSDGLMERFSPSFNFSINRSTPPNSFVQFSPTQNLDLRKNTVDMRPSSADIRPSSVDMRPSPGELKPSDSISPKFPNDEPAYILGSGVDFPHSRENAPNSTSHTLQNSQSSYRYHPYQHHSYNDRNNGISSSSSPGLQRPETPQQCEKCGFICDSHQSLIEHISTAHPPSSNVNFNFNNGFDRQPQVKGEPKAEILDLDSKMVHVYQPPQGEQNQIAHNSELSLPWLNMGQDKHLFNHGHQVNGNQMPSPDYNVTTTTMNPPSDLLPQTYQYDHHINPQLPLQHHITTSSQVPLGNQHSQKSSSSSKSGNGNSWKSNEARRPKTYNCTACNKWFTSSGHLKRHYNTTLHKNAVKQSGIPDPAGLPISNHHHPQKEGMYATQQQESPPAPQLEEQSPVVTPKMEEFERPPIQQQHQQIHFLGNPPNSLAGPSEISGGLLLPSTQQYTDIMPEDMRTIPLMQNQNFLHFPTTPMGYQQGTIYPNFQPPRVTTPQAITSITGNFDVQLLENVDLYPLWAKNTNSFDPLPSFSHNFRGIIPTFAPFSVQNVSTSNDNVGGLSPSRFESYAVSSPVEYSSDTMDTNTFSPQNVTNSETNSLEEAVSLLPPDEIVSTTTENEIIEQKIKQEENSVSSTMLDTPRHRCNDCDKVFNRACYLTQHNKTFHTGDKPHKCEKCGKRFEIVSLLEEHMAKHAGDKPYKCEICPKQFNHKTDLRRHMCLHTGDKPFACTFCGKGFIRKDHMIKHLDTHKRKHNLAKQFPMQHKIIKSEDPLALPVPVVQVMH